MPLPLVALIILGFLLGWLITRWTTREKEGPSRLAPAYEVWRRRPSWHETPAGIAFVDRKIREQRLDDIIKRYGG